MGTGAGPEDGKKVLRVGMGTGAGEVNRGGTEAEGSPLQGGSCSHTQKSETTDYQ